MARHHCTLIQSLAPDRPARFYRDGKRVSRAVYEDIRDAAIRTGRLDCFSTQAKQLPDGRFRRINRTCAMWES